MVKGCFFGQSPVAAFPGARKRSDKMVRVFPV